MWPDQQRQPSICFVGGIEKRRDSLEDVDREWGRWTDYKKGSDRAEERPGARGCQSPLWSWQALTWSIFHRRNVTRHQRVCHMAAHTHTHKSMKGTEGYFNVCFRTPEFRFSCQNPPNVGMAMSAGLFGGPPGTHEGGLATVDGSS